MILVSSYTKKFNYLSKHFGSVVLVMHLTFRFIAVNRKKNEVLVLVIIVCYCIDYHSILLLLL